MMSRTWQRMVVFSAVLVIGSPAALVAARQLPGRDGAALRQQSRRSVLSISARSVPGYHQEVQADFSLDECCIGDAHVEKDGYCRPH